MIITTDTVDALKAAAKKSRMGKGKSIDLFGKLLDYCLSPLAAAVWPLLTFQTVSEAMPLRMERLVEVMGVSTPGMQGLIDSSAAYVANVGIIGTTIVLFYKTLVRCCFAPLLRLLLWPDDAAPVRRRT
jgi:hypothetical protein